MTAATSRRAAIVTVAILVLIAAGFVAVRIPRTISIFLVAAFIAFGAAPLVQRLELRMPRGAAIAVVYVGLMLALTLLALVIVPITYAQILALVSHTSDYVAASQDGVAHLETFLRARLGDRIAQGPKRAANYLGESWRLAVGAAPPPPHAAAGSAEEADHGLERFVDIHAFVPSDLTRVAAGAGFDAITVRGEELLANWFGWFNRVLEYHADPRDVPMWWRRYAFHGYLALQKLDRAALEPRLPASIFYNLLLTAQRPGA